MIEQILSAVTNFIMSVIDSSGYIGVALLMAIESAAIPLPSEVIMPFAGFLASEGRFTLFGISLAGAAGSVLGSWATYFLGKYGGRPLIVKYGRWVLITEHDLNLADNFFAKYGTWAAFIGRVLPVIRTYISIPAGIARVKFWSFTIATFVGSFIWSYLLGWIGFKLGENWESLSGYFHQVDWIIAILIVIGAAWWVRRHWKNRVKN